MSHDYGPPPSFEYVDIAQYSDIEIIEFIKVLTEFMIERNNAKENIVENIDSEITIEDLPF